MWPTCPIGPCAGGLGRGGRGWPVPLSPPRLSPTEQPGNSGRPPGSAGAPLCEHGVRYGVGRGAGYSGGTGAAGRASVPGSGTHLRAKAGALSLHIAQRGAATGAARSRAVIANPSRGIRDSRREGVTHPEAAAFASVLQRLFQRATFAWWRSSTTAFSGITRPPGCPASRSTRRIKPRMSRQVYSISASVMKPGRAHGGMGCPSTSVLASAGPSRCQRRTK